MFKSLRSTLMLQLQRRAFSKGKVPTPPPPPPRQVPTPPPPPPRKAPPTRRKPVERTAPAESSTSQGKPSAAAVGLVFGVPAGFVYYAYNNREQFEGMSIKEVMDTKDQLVSSVSQELGLEESAEDYLKDLSAKDEDAKHVLESVDAAQAPIQLGEAPPRPEAIQNNYKASEEEFRFDVSKDGLIDALQIMLETRRMEEKQIVSDMWKGVASEGYKDQLRAIREEKAGIKANLKRLRQRKGL